MRYEHRKTDAEAVPNIVLLIESAGDIVKDLRDLSTSLDKLLQRSADLGAVIGILHEKKAKVDTLRELACQIKFELRVGPDGRIGVDLPEGPKLRFAQLMADLHKLTEDESRLEELLCGRGLTVSKGVTGR
jgi:hypothetical protein